MQGDEPGKRQNAGASSATDADLTARLKRLDAQLDRVRAAETVRTGKEAPASPGPSPLGRAFRLSAEFISGVGAGGMIGWLVDRFLGLSPWGLIVFLMVGFCAGIYNVMRATGQLKSFGATKPGG